MMKRLVSLIAAAVLFAALAGCSKAPAPAEPAAPAPTLLPMTTPMEPPVPKDPPPALEAAVPTVVFVSPEVGWTADANRILTTSDGGKSWKVAYAATALVKDLAFADSTHGWAAADDGLVRTTDGGQHWAKVSGTTLSHVVFTSPSLGWGVNQDNALLQSSDGGATWAPVQTPSPVDSLCPAGGSTLWASGSNQVIRSSDGGKSWSVVFGAPVEGQGWRTRLGCTAGSVWVQFYGQGAMSQQQHVTFRSGDGGKTWTALEQEAMFHSSYPTVTAEYELGAYSAPFAVLSDTTGLFLGECPACNPGSMVSFHRTTDGGKTWTRTQVPLLSAAKAISFASPDKGWVVGRTENGDAILATSDGGVTWHQVYPGR